jgi:hypothetical protein
MKHDPEGTIVELQWVYTPSDFFEELVTWERCDYRVEMRAGRVTARMTAAFYDTHPDLHACLDANLRYYFKGTALTRQNAFELRQDGSTRTFPNGQRHITITPESGRVTVTSDSPDVLATRADGTIRNPRRERIAQTQRLGELARLPQLAPDYMAFRVPPRCKLLILKGAGRQNRL